MKEMLVQKHILVENHRLTSIARCTDMPTSEPPSPADNDAAAFRHDCAATPRDSPCASRGERERERTCEKVSPPTPPPTESESKATQEVLTREHLLGKKISYAGGHTGMRAREDEEEHWVRSERQRYYEAWLAAKHTKTPNQPKDISDNLNPTPAHTSPAQPTPHKSDSDSTSDAVSTPEPDPGSLAAESESTQKQDLYDGKTTRRATGLRRTKSARWSQESRRTIR